MFIQQLVVAYVPHGYWFHVPGWTPFNKDAEAINRKSIESYGIDMSAWERARGKKTGLTHVNSVAKGTATCLCHDVGETR